MKTFRGALLFCLATTLSFSQHSVAGPWPALQTDQDKLEYGLALRAQMKPFFTGTYNYGMEWWNITTEQEKIKNALEGLYPKEMDLHPLSTLTLSKVTEKEVPSATVISAWKQGLLDHLAARPATTTRRDLIAELNQRSAQLQTYKVGDLITQLVSATPGKHEDRIAVMKMPTAAKLAHIRAELPEDLSQTTFYTNSKGRYTNAFAPSKEKALELVQTLLNDEEEIVPLLGLIVATDELGPDANLAQLKHSIASIDVPRMGALESPDHVMNALNKALTSLGATTPDLSERVKWNANLFGKLVAKVSAQGTEKIGVDTAVLQLVEKPRELAILKSAIGDDCSHTWCSFSKADDPNSRIFFVVDTLTGKEIGYVEAQIKSSSLGDVLYVTSIEGPTISPAQAEEILYMLHSQRANLGVTTIMIAKNNLENFMNYDGVVQFLKSKIANRATIHVQPKNAEAAAVVDSFVKLGYMKESQNTEAVAYEPESHTSSFHVALAHSPNDQIFKRKLDPKEVQLFALELDATERWETAAGQPSDGERAILAAGMSLDHYRQLRDTLRNADHLPYQNYIERAQRVLGGTGLVVDKAFMSDHPHLFYEGQLAASDAVSGPLRKSTFRLATQMMKRAIWYTTWGLKEFGKSATNLEAINQSKELDDVFKWAMGDMSFHSFELLNVAEAGIGLPKFREPQVTKSLLKTLAHGHSWGPDKALLMLRLAYGDLREVTKAYQHDEDSQVRDGVAKLLLTHPEAKLIDPAADHTHAASSAPHRAEPMTCQEIF